MITETELLNQIEAFCALHKLTDTDFGYAALGDFSFIEDLRTRARSPKLKTVNKILTFMQNYNPEKTK